MDIDEAIEKFENGEMTLDEYLEIYNNWVKEEADKRVDLWNS